MMSGSSICYISLVHGYEMDADDDENAVLCVRWSFIVQMCIMWWWEHSWLLQEPNYRQCQEWEIRNSFNYVTMQQWSIRFKWFQHSVLSGHFLFGHFTIFIIKCSYFLSSLRSNHQFHFFRRSFAFPCVVNVFPLGDYILSGRLDGGCWHREREGGREKKVFQIVFRYLWKRKSQTVEDIKVTKVTNF